MFRKKNVIAVSYYKRTRPTGVHARKESLDDAARPPAPIGKVGVPLTPVA